MDDESGKSRGSDVVGTGKEQSGEEKSNAEIRMMLTKRSWDLIPESM